MARVYHFAGETKDLDVWVEAGTADDRLEEALLAWVKQFPRHVSNPNSFKPPLNIRPNVQVHFPERDVYYQSVSGEWSLLKATAGIDLLTSRPPLDFESAFSKAYSAEIGGITAPAASHSRHAAPASQP
jgi:hypothetical protein